jgi:chemotaxis protein MotB
MCTSSRSVLSFPSLFAVVVAVVVAAPGCVTAGTYDDLVMVHERAKRDQAEAELVRDQELRRREAAQAEAKAQLEAFEKERAQAAADHAALTAQLEQAEGALKHSNDELAKSLKDKAGLKSSVEEMQSAITELNRRKAEADRRMAEYKSLLSRFQSLIDAGKLKIKIVDGRMVVALASDILFPSGSAGLSKDGEAAVREIAGLLSSIPNRSFQVEGHTDDVPIRTAQFPSNWELAAARSLTVLKTMADAGLDAGRISAASYGAQKPAVPNTTPENKAQNRRIEIVVVPDLSTLPGFDELKAAAQG